MARTHMPRRALDRGLSDLGTKTLALGKNVTQMLEQSVNALKSRAIEQAEMIIIQDQDIDRDALELETAAEVLIARHQPVASDLRRVISTMRIAVDLERIADLAVNIARITVDLGDEPLLKPLIDIPRMATITQEMVQESMIAFVEEDLNRARRVYHRDEEVDGLYLQILRELLSYMLQDPRTIQRAIALLFVARHLERVGDHATNIAETVTYLLTGERTIGEVEAKE